MSSIGKIFVVVNLVLSLLVVGAAGALLQTEEDAAQKLSDAQAAATQAETELADLRSEGEAQRRALESQKSQLENDKQDLEVARDNADRDAKRETADNQQLRDDLTRLTATMELLQSDLAESASRNTDLVDANDGLRREAADAKDAQRSAELARRDAVDEADAIRGQIDALDRDLTAALAQVQEKERMLEVAVASGFDPSAVMAQPQIEAVVADVDAEYNFVILDKGRADGVQRGFTFDVYRGSDWLGQVRVDNVEESTSVASVIVSDGAMKRFDQATTRL